LRSVGEMARSSHTCVATRSRLCPGPRVVIQEAMQLADRFAGPQSARFVNGVVDALARRMGQL
jgi:hypothetical protein